MKLISCHIENFGKLQDCSFEFSEGIHTICEDNGWGKSTFAAFIRAMFYGLEGERKRSIEENERKRYKPWQSGVFGGQLVFETGGTEYEITRIFGEKEANDLFELREAKTNLLSDAFSEKIGQELFLIGREAFLRTIFIGESICETKVTDDIHAKIGNITDEANDINNFESADGKLAELLNHMSPTRKTGSIAKRKEEIARLESMIQDGRKIPAGMDAYRKMIQEEEEKGESLKGRLRELSKLQEKASGVQAVIAKKEERFVLFKLTDKERSELEELDDGFRAGIPEETELDIKIKEAVTYGKKQQEYAGEGFGDKEQERFQELEDLFANDVEDVSVISGKWNERNNKKAALVSKKAALTALQTSAGMQKKEGVWSFPVVIGMVVGLCGVMLVVGRGWVPGVILMTAGALVSGASVWRNKKRQKNLLLELQEKIHLAEMEITQDKEWIEKTDAEVRNYLKVHGEEFEETQNAFSLQRITEESIEYRSLQQKKIKWREREHDKELVELENSIKGFIQKYQPEASGGNYLDPLYGLQNKLLRYRTLAQKEENYKLAKSEYDDYMENQEKLPSLTELNQTINDVTDELQSIHKKITNCSKQLEELSIRYDDWEEQRMQMDMLLQVQAAEERKYGYLKQARKKLNQAKEKLTAQYTEPMRNAFCRYYEGIAGECADAFRVDANINLTINQQGKQRELNTQSTGYRDLIGICLRMAFLDAMYTSEKPMLILDDPFTHLDDHKQKLALRFLQTVAKEYQVIYFTCSDVRRV